MLVSEIIKERAAESGHWYKDGMPAYTVIGKNGKERPATLRDARKLRLKRGVTDIIREAHSEGLVRWKEEQAIMAALTMPLQAGETDKEYIARIKADARVEAATKATRGTQIHAWIQQGFEDEPLNNEAYQFFEIAYNEIIKYCGYQNWLCEQSFSIDKYGGKVDLNCSEYIIDIKTKESAENAKLFDEHYMQLAAYQHGIEHQGLAGICFVSTKEPIKAKLIWAEPEKLVRGLEMFDALVEYYYAKTGL